MPEPKLREARFDDCAAVIALSRRNGHLVPSSASHWQWLWQDNPAVAHCQDWPIGWVLEDGNGIVGYLGNVFSTCYLNGRRLRIAAARNFVVDSAFRGHSLRLAASFFSQKNADLLLNTSANEAAGSVFRLCKAQRIPQPGYDKILFWIVHERAVIQAYLRKRGHPAWQARLGGAILAPAVAAEGIFRKRHRPRPLPGSEIKLLDPEQIGPEFDALWKYVLETRSDRLLSDRSAATLRWHFNRNAAVERRAKVLTVWAGGTLLAYAVVTREDSGPLDLKRCRISDLLAKDDDPAAIDQLLAAANEYAKANDSDTLELMGFPQHIRERFLIGRPQVYQLPYWPYWYKAPDPDLAAALMQERVWYGSPYDGDATL